MKRMPLSVPLSFNGGYVDTAGFLALQGLFPAHVTGNFVTLGATVVMGTSGALSKLLALPMFCLVVLVSRIVGLLLHRAGKPVLRCLLTAKVVLLFASAVFAVIYGPFGASTPTASLIMGMTLVAAMAVQNALHRVHLTKSPPSTLMTGTTTQIMLDLAEIVAADKGESSAVALGRVKKMAVAVLVFAIGCACAALAVLFSPVWCFFFPAVVSLFSFAAKIENPEGD
ncbi:YoaK family protein [Rhizobium mesoamericanum]|uniref:YoaK family protein n=1 Tax=Rhizobium mesoamericanum TaxID=1079800 RepID=UPI00041136CB|nr:YoaK family protein [Rhizobium mesoamericanum]